jgi:hypothetical protein
MTARIVLLVAGAMAFLAASAAFAFQAVRNQPEVTVPVAVAAVPAQETVTPLTARPVRTVSIIKPGATPQAASEADHVENHDTTDVGSAPGGARGGEGRPPAAASTSTASVASLAQEQSDGPGKEQARAIGTLPTKPSHARKRSSVVAKRSPRRAKSDDQVAEAQEPAPSQPAYDDRNDYDSLIDAQGKLLSGAP